MKKRFGQNLLTDKNYLTKIISAVDLDLNDIVLEIGAGSGFLTTVIAEKVKKIFAVEPERDILKKLKKNVNCNKYENIKIVECDFLKLDICDLARSCLGTPLKIIGNIPYNITSKILIKLFGEIDKPALHLNLISEVYLMLQYEVAKRIAAEPNSKEYSPLTLLVQYFSNPKILFIVPKTAFYPVPEVNSAFVRFAVKKKLRYVDKPQLLKNVIRTCFQQRRKKAINALAEIVCSKEHLINIFNKLNLRANIRAENLSFENFLSLSNML